MTNDKQPGFTLKIIKNQVRFCMSKSNFRYHFEDPESIFNISRPIRGQENAKIDQKHNFKPKNRSLLSVYGPVIYCSL